MVYSPLDQSLRSLRNRGQSQCIVEARRNSLTCSRSSLESTVSVLIGICWGIGLATVIGVVAYRAGYENGRKQVSVDELEKMWFQQ